MAPPTKDALRDILVYETKTRYYLFAFTRAKRWWRVLSFGRAEENGLDVRDDPKWYSEAEAAALLRTIEDGNAAHGGVTLVTKACGVVGAIRFLQGWHLLLTTRRRRLGTVCGHEVYGVDATETLYIPNPVLTGELTRSPVAASIVDTATQAGTALGKFFGVDAAAAIPVDDAMKERRYLRTLAAVDLTRDFFFSYTYNVEASVQANLAGGTSVEERLGSMFVWNAHLMRPLVEALGAEAASRWVTPLTHGFFQQTLLSVFGRPFTVTLVSRRSRYFAGTRYRKRGVSDAGHVANEVETEQIIDVGAAVPNGPPRIASSVQVRGSIPLFWSQEVTPISPKPDIMLKKFDPLYAATLAHFADLERRYGLPNVTLSLIKDLEKHPREMVLRREFASAVRFMNATLPAHRQIPFVHWDFSRRVKTGSGGVLNELVGLCRGALDVTGFFACGVNATRRSLARVRTDQGGSDDAGSAAERCEDAAQAWRAASAVRVVPPTAESLCGQKHCAGSDADVWLQHGVLRTNCIDCLDRTNVTQYAFGCCALGRQLHALGLLDSPDLDVDSSVALTLMDMYQAMGDVLALQYGGSEAHTPILAARRGQWRVATQTKEAIVSMRRFYNNAYTDDEKQDAINLFLGNFVPEAGQTDLWNLSSDYYLHGGGDGGAVERVPERACAPPSTCPDEVLRRARESWGPYGNIGTVGAGAEPDELVSLDEHLAERPNWAMAVRTAPLSDRGKESCWAASWLDVMRESKGVRESADPPESGPAGPAWDDARAWLGERKPEHAEMYAAYLRGPDLLDSDALAGSRYAVRRQFDTLLQRMAERSRPSSSSSPALAAWGAACSGGLLEDLAMRRREALAALAAAPRPEDFAAPRARASVASALADAHRFRPPPSAAVR